MNETRFRFETAAVTHEGRVRDHNEDSYLLLPEQGVWLVADGMGGHYGGEIAAASIVEHVGSIGRSSSAPDLQARFVDRIDRANREIRELSHRQDEATIGATVAALLVYDSHFACVWSGDSRVYLMRGGTLTQLSRDHTEVQELLDSGAITEEQAENWPRRNVITRAVGVHEEAVLDHVYGTLKDRDLFLLCSDGLTAHVDDAELPGMLAGNQPQAICDRLLELTLERGATDNVTLVLVRCMVKTVVDQLGGNAGYAQSGREGQGKP